MSERFIPAALRTKARAGMFGNPQGARSPAQAAPFLPISDDPVGRILNPRIGAASPPSIFSYPLFSPLASAGRCQLVPLNPNPGTVAPTAEDLRFSPAFSDIVRNAADSLGRQGMRLSVNNGFRTAADQWKMTHGGSGKNPAAKYSDHQLGNAVDINGTHLPSFASVIQAFKQAGAKWGGDYRMGKDPPHFYIRPIRASAANTAECERENPR